MKRSRILVLIQINFLLHLGFSNSLLAEEQNIPNLVKNEEWIRANVKAGGASIYGKPTPESGPLGKYPETTKIFIHLPAQGKYYSVYFDKVWKGMQTGWVLATEVEIQEDSTEVNPLAGLRDDHQNIVLIPPPLGNPGPVKPKGGFSFGSIGSFSLNLGVLGLQYSQTAVAILNETMGYGKINFDIPTGPHFEVQGDFSGTYSELSTTRPGIHARLFAAHLNLGFTPLPKFPILLTLFGGATASTLAVSNQIFGYDPLFYPQLYPMIRTNLSRSLQIAGFFKWTPLSFSNLNLAEITAGGSLSFALGGSSALSINFELSSLSNSYAAKTISIQQNYWAASVGYTL